LYQKISKNPRQKNLLGSPAAGGFEVAYFIFSDALSDEVMMPL
jgi:hypothetical protein